MYTQQEIDFLHTVENNNGSQNHLEENYVHFNKQCLQVLNLLKRGDRLSVYDAIVVHGINSLPRRIKDLREHGIIISDEWVKEAGINKYKVYFLPAIGDKTFKNWMEK